MRTTYGRNLLVLAALSAGLGLASEALAQSPPALLAPAGNIGTVQPTYRWSPVAGATSYRLQVRDAVDERVVDRRYVASSVCSASECAATPSEALVGGAYRWRMLTGHAGGDGLFGPEVSFFAPTWGGGVGCQGLYQAADFSGDGRTDRLCSREGMTNVALSTGTASWTPRCG
jgi:hypothetical protein